MKLGAWVGRMVMLCLLGGCAGGAASEPSVQPADGSCGLGSPRGPVASRADEVLAPPGQFIGTMDARIPGTSDVVSGIRLRSHRVTAIVRDGFARTTVEQEFENESGRVLEGRYTFAVPPGSVLSRLALWVVDRWMDGEIVAKRRAAGIFRDIVDDTVRPRDPALLEQIGTDRFSLKVFPMPAHRSRKVIYAYDQVLGAEDGRVRFVVPLAFPADRKETLGEISVSVNLADSAGDLEHVEVQGPIGAISHSPSGVVAHYESVGVVPSSDWSFAYPRTLDETRAAATMGELGRDRYVALRFTPVQASGRVLQSARTDARVVVFDKSHRKSKEQMRSEMDFALSTIGAMAEDAHFAIVACDSACASYPSASLARANAHEIDAARQWADSLAPSGSFDLAGAIVEASDRASLAPSAQVVVLTDGVVTSGEISGKAIVARVAPALARRRLDLRLLGVGRTVDDATLGWLAGGLGCTYRRIAAADQRAIVALSKPVLERPALDLPDGVVDVEPAALPNLEMDQPTVVFARISGGALGGSVTLRGTIGGEPFDVDLPVATEGDSVSVVPGLYAARKIRTLEATGGGSSEIVKLSRSFHVTSRETSLLVLENEAMFAEYGIARTTRSIDPAFDPTPAAAGFGNGQGRSGGTHAARSPQIRMGSSMVSGRLPPETIQWIVRQNFGRFRFCYENGLRDNPGLAGRIVVRFVIGRDGSVALPSDNGSDLPDPAVVACVVRAFRSLAFPQPEGGIVTVVYPLVFSSDGSRPPGPPNWHAEPEPAPRSVAESQAPEADEKRFWGARWRTVDNEWRPKFAVTHETIDSSFMRMDDAQIARLVRDVADEPQKRSRHEALIRGLVAHGRGAEAIDAARRYADMDPDSIRALELRAHALALGGDARAAAATLDDEASLDALRVAAHRRARAAFEAVGDLRRACAHQRSIDSLVARELTGGGLSDCRMPDASTGRGQALRATVHCASTDVACPLPIVIDQSGSVRSPVTPGAGAASPEAAFVANVSQGIYRTLLVGGDPAAKGTLEISSLGVAKTVAFEPDSRPMVGTRVTVSNWNDPARLRRRIHWAY